MLCKCERCRLIDLWFRLCDSLSYFYGEGKLYCWYLYLDDDANEIAHQEGMKAGLEFRMEEIKGTSLDSYCR